MTQPGHLVRWWSFAERAAARLTAPRINADGTDADVGRVLSASRLSAVLSSVVSIFERAWRHAWLAQAARRTITPWLTLPTASKIRMIGWITTVAGGTALLVQALRPMPVGPLSWLLPLTAAAGGALAATTAGLLAGWIASPRS